MCTDIFSTNIVKKKKKILSAALKFQTHLCSVKQARMGLEVKQKPMRLPLCSCPFVGSIRQHKMPTVNDPNKSWMREGLGWLQVSSPNLFYYDILPLKLFLYCFQNKMTQVDGKILKVLRSISLGK